MRVALIIVNYNTYELTKQCVDSILENCVLDYKIILVDNCSENDSAKKLNELYSYNPKIQFVQSPENRGYSAGLNYGLQECRNDGYDIFVFLNNDLYFEKNSLENLMDTFEEYESIGVAGGQIVGADRERQLGYKYLLTFKTHLSSMKPFYYFCKPKEQTDGYNYNKIMIFDGMVAGCCFAIPRVVMDKLGKLDENMFIYFEEDALAHRMHDMGLKCALNPKSIIVHLGSQTISSSAFTYFNRYKSALYVLKKYCNVTRCQLFLIYSIYKISFLMKLCKGNEYKKYYREFCNFYKKLSKEV